MSYAGEYMSIVVDSFREWRYEVSLDIAPFVPGSGGHWITNDIFRQSLGVSKQQPYVLISVAGEALHQNCMENVPSR